VVKEITKQGSSYGPRPAMSPLMSIFGNYR
jgi:hypothetical protein